MSSSEHKILIKKLVGM